MTVDEAIAVLDAMHLPSAHRREIGEPYEPMHTACETLRAGPGLEAAAQARIRAAVFPDWTLRQQGDDLVLLPVTPASTLVVLVPVGAAWWPAPEDLPLFRAALTALESSGAQGLYEPVLRYDDDRRQFFHMHQRSHNR